MADTVELKKDSRDVDIIHLYYIGGLLMESMKNFHDDLIMNCKFAPEVVSRQSYLRMSELRDKFETTALLQADKVRDDTIFAS